MKISKQNAEHCIWGDACDGWHLVKNKELSIIHERMAVNTSEVRHFHKQARQFFYVLSGTATLEVNGERIILNSQEGVEIAPLINLMLNAPSCVSKPVFEQPWANLLTFVFALLP
ncbi:cupin domain-containing protein [Metabacillus sp. Hm71]|uniref:cupin domain-containing protein n=1 Tax=Metabacillus sp. Hm71 TaxID=3450743 RepID=UPI003F41FDBF